MKSVSIVLGYACNNNCIFCLYGENKKKGNRSTEEIKKTLETIKKDTSSISITGGDATIRSDFLEILEFAKNLGFNITLETNGRSFSNIKFAEKVLEIVPNIRFSISLHHIKPEIADYLSGGIKGSWIQTVSGIRNLINLGNKNIVIASVVFKQNYKFLHEMVKFLNTLGIKNVDFILVRKEGYARVNYQNLAPKIEKVTPYLLKAFEEGRKNNMQVRSYGFPFCCIQGYEKHAFELGLIYSKLRGKKSFFNFGDFEEDHFKGRLKRRRIKFLKCKKCKYYNICEGVWSGYFETFGDREFQPIKGKKIENRKELADLLNNSK